MRSMFLISAAVGALLLSGCVKYASKRVDPFTTEFDGVEYTVAKVVVRPSGSSDDVNWEFRNYAVKIGNRWYNCPEGAPVESCADTVERQLRFQAMESNSSGGGSGGGGGGGGGGDTDL